MEYPLWLVNALDTSTTKSPSCLNCFKDHEPLRGQIGFSKTPFWKRTRTSRTAERSEKLTRLVQVFSNRVRGSHPLRKLPLFAALPEYRLAERWNGLS